MVVMCSFCHKSYDMNKTPRPKLVGNKMAAEVYICEACLKLATDICVRELGDDWPPSKRKKPGGGAA